MEISKKSTTKLGNSEKIATIKEFNSLENTVMIIDGRAIANNILEWLHKKVQKLPKTPKLMVVLAGDSPASLSYIKQKEKSAVLAGIDFELRQYSVDIQEEELIKIIQDINTDASIDGVIVQLPLPTHIETNTVIETIDPRKDVDGFTAENIGKLFLWTGELVSCTPKGIMRLLSESDVKIAGQNVVVIGKSNIVGKPLSLLLMNAGATVTVCHKETRDLKEFTKNADIIIVAAGYPGLVKKDMVRPGATIIDVWFTLVNGRIRWDADFEALEPINLITPVPGWVGPMTVAMLMENIYLAAKNRI